MLVLEAEIGDGKVNRAVIVNDKAIPKHQDIEHCHSVGQAALQILPLAVHHFLEMGHQSQHGKNSFLNHAGVPLSPPTDFEIIRMPILFLEPFVSKYNHILDIALDKLLKPRTIVNIGRIDIPIHNQPDVVEHQAQFAPDNPPFVGDAFLPDLFCAATFSSRMNEFNAITNECGQADWETNPDNPASASDRKPGCQPL